MDPASHDWVSAPTQFLTTPNCPVCGKFTIRSATGWSCGSCEGNNVQNQPITTGLSHRGSNQQDMNRNGSGTSDFNGSAMNSTLSIPLSHSQSPAPVLSAHLRDPNSNWEVFDVTSSSPPELSPSLQPYLEIFHPTDMVRSRATSIVLSTTATHASSESDSDSSASGEFSQSNNSSLDHIQFSSTHPFGMVDLQSYLAIFRNRTPPQEPTSETTSHSPQNVLTSSEISPRSDASWQQPENELNLSPSLREFFGRSELKSEARIGDLQATSPDSRAFSYPQNRSFLKTPEEIPQPRQLVWPIIADLMEGQPPLPQLLTYGISSISEDIMQTIGRNLFGSFQALYAIQNFSQPWSSLLVAEEHLKNFANTRIYSNPIAMLTEPRLDQLTKFIENSWISITILDMAYLHCDRRVVQVHSPYLNETAGFSPSRIAFFGHGRDNDFRMFSELVRKLRNPPQVTEDSLAYIHCSLLFEKDATIKQMLEKYFSTVIPARHRFNRITDFIRELSTEFQKSLVEKRDQGKLENLKTTNRLFYELVNKF